MVNSTFESAEKTQIRRNQAERAIQLAMTSRWEEAVTVNRAIIRLFPNDADSYNRLGKALMELRRYGDAKKAYKKALELDGTNQIARKNLNRLIALVKAGGAQAETAHVDPTVFIEEMGKSAVTTLERTSADGLTRLNAGDGVELRPEGKTVNVETASGEFIGAIEPKLAQRLFRLLEGGNKYTAAITTLSDHECRLIIKETYRDPSQAGPSFPTAIAAEGTRPYTKGSLIRRGTEVDAAERGEEAPEGDGVEDEGEGRESWEGERVLPEGHVPLSQAAAAEDAEDEELEE